MKGHAYLGELIFDEAPISLCSVNNRRHSVVNHLGCQGAGNSFSVLPVFYDGLMVRLEDRNVLAIPLCRLYGHEVDMVVVYLGLENQKSIFLSIHIEG